jgi:hypothetical protein
MFMTHMTITRTTKTRRIRILAIVAKTVFTLLPEFGGLISRESYRALSRRLKSKFREQMGVLGNIARLDI